MSNSETIKTDGLDSNIDTLRASIDQIDIEILDLINRRLLLAKKIGGIKKQKGEKVLDTARESNIINRLLSLNKGPLSKNALHHIFTEIIASSREVQKKEVVTYLGPEATFTHIAAMNHFGHTVSFVPQ
ncbi:MAG: chorismate mutase, partial [Proteobacteria bacterium]|nr:chorismate mutase [Pseudomonadota bacterium]